MIAYEVSVNGQRCCIAGVGEAGVLSAIVTWVRRFEPDGSEAIEHELTVGGLATASEREREHLDWLKRELKPGDEVLVKVVEAREVDPPKRRQREDPALVENAQRRYYERLKEKYEAEPAGPDHT